MKCFSRYLPYLFRPSSTILSSSCHTEVPLLSACVLRPAPMSHDEPLFNLWLLGEGDIGSPSFPWVQRPSHPGLSWTYCNRGVNAT
ncbi:unnamed protein product [Coregonus sp. 'balchen']|nr:unnamed protein product [Coregonus sp. 'balchen']